MNAHMDAFRPQAEPAARRLQDSRARIRDWMQATTEMRDRPAGAQPSASWLDLLGEIPVLGKIVLGVRAALRNSPIPVVARLAERAGNEALRPTAKRHPLALVGVAAAGGAFLLWAKPWRTVLRSALLAGMLSQLGSRLIAQIPLASVLDALQSVARRPTSTGTEHRHPSESQEGIRRSG